jgi:hypothetical protein
VSSDRSSLREKWASISFEKKVGMFVAPVFISVVTGILIPMVLGGGSPSSGTKPSSKTALEVVDLEADNTPEEVPRIEVTVRNSGNLISIVTRLDVRIRRHRVMEACFHTTGRLSISGTYDLTLPLEDGEGKLVPVKVSQQVSPNTADRFAFTITTSPMVRSGVFHLYQLDVALYHDAEVEPIEAGSLVIAMPFPDSTVFAVFGATAQERRRCKLRVAQNQATLAAMLASGEPSNALASFAKDQGAN